MIQPAQALSERIQQQPVATADRRKAASGVQRQLLVACFPLLVTTLSIIHRVSRHDRILFCGLAALCAASWIGSFFLLRPAASTFACDAVAVLKWISTLMLVAYTAVQYFTKQVHQNLNSPVRALYDCLKLPPAPSAAKKTGGGFRFRRASSEADIRLIAQLCAREPIFAAANPSLKVEQRTRLYMNWFEASSHSFYMLEHQSAQDTKVVAVSIILPLTAEGATKLWSGEAGVLDLGKAEISHEQSDTVRILLDTLFIAKEFRGIATHKKYPWALVLKHLSAFIDSKSRQVQTFVLPDVPSTRKMMRQVGFEGPHSTKKERGLYRINVVKRLSLVPESAVDAIAFMPAKPMAKLVALLLEAEIVARILQNIEICRHWEMQNG